MKINLEKYNYLEKFEKSRLSIIIADNLEEIIKNDHFMVIDFNSSSFSNLKRSIKLKKILNQFPNYKYNFIMVKNFDFNSYNDVLKLKNDGNLVLHCFKLKYNEYLYASDFIYDLNDEKVVKTRFID